MRKVTVPLAALALLAACNGESTDGGDTAPAEKPIPVEPDGGIGDGAGPPKDALALAEGAIPGQFLGVWDYQGGTCDRASDMRMEVSAGEIEFYESLGSVTGVNAEGEDIVVSLDMEGEGQTWQQKIRFSLVGEDDTLRLHLSDGDAPKVRDIYPRKRCPA